VTRALAILAAAVLLTGCTKDAGAPSATTSSPASASSSVTHPPRATKPPSPRVGACYPLTYQQALAPTTEVAPVRCNRSHTATTYYVGTLDTVVDGHLLAVDAELVRAQVARECPAKLDEFLHATPAQLRLSVLRPVWFSPTVEQSDSGQDWFRCDVIALAADEELAPQKGGLAGVLGTPQGRKQYGVCGTAEPGTAGFERIMCDARSAWRAISTYNLTGRKYPGQDAVRAVGQGRCKRDAKAVAEDALNYQWGYDWPTARQWAAGTRFGLCWAPNP